MVALGRPFTFEELRAKLSLVSSRVASSPERANHHLSAQMHNLSLDCSQKGWDELGISAMRCLVLQVCRRYQDARCVGGTAMLSLAGSSISYLSR